jgi:hypothetical protein
MFLQNKINQLTQNMGANTVFNLLLGSIGFMIILVDF